MEEKKQGSKGFAIVALIMGILAIINSFIPVINFVAYIFAVLGIIFGIIGIVKKNGLPLAIVGLVLAGVALILATVINAGTANVLNDELDTSAAPATNSSTNTNTKTNTSQPKFSYTIDSQYLGDYGFGYYVEGTVTNNRDKDYSYIYIEFICYDSAGNNLGTATDSSSNLLGNQTWKYKAIFTGSDDEAVDHCDYHEITGW